MIANLTSSTIDMASAGLLHIDSRADVAVTCESGLVWVTVEGEPADHWLVAGDALSVVRPGRIVIEAAQASRIAVRETPPSSRSLRWPAFLSRRVAQALAA